MGSKSTASGAIAAPAIWLTYVVAWIEQCIGWHRIFHLVNDVADAASTGDQIRVQFLLAQFAANLVRDMLPKL